MTFRRLLLCCALLAPAIAPARIVDDFGAGDWRAFADTPGTLTIAPGALRLVDAPGGPDWMTVHKLFEVDLSVTPLFLIEVTALTQAGSVKLIRQEPHDKRNLLRIERPGLFAVNLVETLGWQGRVTIDTCLYAGGDEAAITYAQVAFADALTPAEEARMAREEREARALRLVDPPLELVPSFVSCSWYFQSDEVPGLQVAYRTPGGAWQPGWTPSWFPEESMYRGSLVRLAEETAYELRLSDGAGRVLATRPFQTWSSHPPIARTVELSAANFDGSLRITEQGRPDGWIRYTAAPDFVLRNGGDRSLLVLDQAKYVILDGLTLRGGGRNAIELLATEQVRVVNCDVAGWGRPGYQRFDLDGKYYLAPTGASQAINWDAAIVVRRCHGTVIERCWIHDPVTTANPWYYSHPAGPQAVGIDKPTATVLRYNDFVGSDRHRWNDAVEGNGNFHVDGGFNRDADIYGEFYCFANDDAIEIDGGQTNVRVFDNKFEGCHTGISVQGCLRSPSYLFNNLLVNMADERGIPGQSIKTTSTGNGADAVTHVFNNTLWGNNNDLSFTAILKVIAYNNISAGRKAFNSLPRSPASVSDYNLLVRPKESEPAEPHGLVGDPGLLEPAAGRFGLAADSPAVGRGRAIDNFTAPGQPVSLGAVGDLPLRPLPVTVDYPQLTFTPADAAAGAARTVTATVTAAGFEGAWRIAQNDACDWFTVTPAAGTLRSGETLPLTVQLRPDRLRERTDYRGAFLLRFADGLSRPVVVYATTDVEPPARPTAEGAWSEFLEAEAPAAGAAGEIFAEPTALGGQAVRLAGQDAEAVATYRFTVPRAGVYHVLARLRGTAPEMRQVAVQFGLGDEPLQRANVWVRPVWRWCLLVSQPVRKDVWLRPWPLTAGPQTIRLAPRGALEVDCLALTDSPELFD